MIAELLKIFGLNQPNKPQAIAVANDLIYVVEQLAFSYLTNTTRNIQKTRILLPNV